MIKQTICHLLSHTTAGAFEELWPRQALGKLSRTLLSESSYSLELCNSELSFPQAVRWWYGWRIGTGRAAFSLSSALIFYRTPSTLRAGRVGTASLLVCHRHAHTVYVRLKCLPMYYNWWSRELCLFALVMRLTCFRWGLLVFFCTVLNQGLPSGRKWWMLGRLWRNAKGFLSAVGGSQFFLECVSHCHWLLEIVRLNKYIIGRALY